MFLETQKQERKERRKEINKKKVQVQRRMREI